MAWSKRCEMDLTTKTVVDADVDTSTSTCKDRRPPKIVVTPPTIREILSRVESYRGSTLIERDTAIAASIGPAIRWLSKRKIMDMTGYLDVGCGTMIPTIEFAEILGVLPQGVDIMDRNISPEEEIYHYVDGDLTLENEPEQSLDVITLTDILHHVPDPERLVETSIKMLTRRGVLIIYDLDCQSWEEAYYLDLLHKTFSLAVGEETDDYLPVYGYRKREFWRSFMAERGYKIVWRCTPMVGYRSYVDVFRR